MSVETSDTKRSIWRTLLEALALLCDVADDHARRSLALTLAIIGLGALLAAGAPIALQRAVDNLASGPKQVLLAPSLLVAVYVAAQYLSRVSAELRILTFGQAEQRLRRLIAASAFDHAVHLPLRFLLERKGGEIGEIVEQGVRGYQLVLTHLMYTVLPVAVEFLVVVVVLLHSEQYRYIAILGASAVAYAFAFWCGAVSIRAPADSASRSHIETRGLLTDALANCEAVKCFDAEGVVVGRYDAALRRTEEAWKLFFRRRAVNGVVVASIFVVSLGSSMFLATADVIEGTMTVGVFILVNSYVMRIVQPLEMLGFAIRDIAQGAAFMASMLRMFAETRECSRGVGATRFRPHRGELVIDKVSFSYERGRRILTDVSFSVQPGRTVALVGASGSGKSSLVRLLFRLYEPDSGRILLDGAPLSDLTVATVRQSIAVVPQDTVLFHDTIARNIGFGRRGSSQSEIEEAARMANLHEFILNLPDGYETVVGERGLKLSGGERQRVAIARAALKRPRIFVFDEATSALDSRTERDILCNLRDVSLRTTTLVIAHRLSTVVHADEILVLEGGRIVQRGRHGDLQRNTEGPYAMLWRAQYAEST